MIWRRQGMVAVLLCAMLGAAQAQPKPPAAPRGPRVVESFEVGENVYVRALKVEPATRTLWVGTSTGVNEVDLASGKLRNTFTRTHGLANEYVFAVGIDRQGYKWFGTNAGGTSRYRDGQWKTFFPMHGLADYWVYAFANDSAGQSVDRHLGGRITIRPAQWQTHHLREGADQRMGVRHRRR